MEQDEWEDDDFFVHDEEPLERPLVDVLKDLPTSPEASSADSESEADAESSVDAESSADSEAVSADDDESDESDDDDESAQ